MEQNPNNMNAQMKQAGSSIQEAVHETASSAKHMAQRAGEALESAADKLHEPRRKDSTVGEAADAVTRTVKETSAYLHEQGVGGVVEDLEVLIRRYPLQTLLLGLGCGYLLSRARTD